MPETTDSDKISWEVPEGFCLGETINGAKILLPEFVMEASKQQFAAYRKVVGYDVYSAAGGVSFILPHLRSTAFGYTFPFGHKVCDRPRCFEPATVCCPGQMFRTSQSVLERPRCFGPARLNTPVQLPTASARTTSTLCRNDAGRRHAGIMSLAAAFSSEFDNGQVTYFHSLVR